MAKTFSLDEALQPVGGTSSAATFSLDDAFAPPKAPEVPTIKAPKVEVSPTTEQPTLSSKISKALAGQQLLTPATVGYDIMKSAFDAAIDDKKTFKKELAKELATAPTDDKTSVASAAVSGTAKLMGDLTALAGRTGMMPIPDAEKQIEKYNKLAAESYTPTTKGWTEAPVEHVKELAGQSFPYMVAPVAIGAVAAEAPVAGAATIGAFVPSFVQFVGSGLSRQMDEGVKLGDTNLLKAGIAAVPSAALDTLSFHMLPGTRQIFQKAGIELTDAMAKEIAKKTLLTQAGEYLLATGKGVTVEGLTEAAQQIFERWQAGLSLTDPKARKEYFDNFVGGGVLGGLIGLPGHAMEQAAKEPEIQAAREAAAAEQARTDALAKAQAMFKPGPQAAPLAQRLQESGLEEPGKPFAQPAPAPTIPPQMVMPGQEAPAAPPVEPAPVAAPAPAAAPAAEQPLPPGFERYTETKPDGSVVSGVRRIEEKPAEAPKETFTIDEATKTQAQINQERQQTKKAAKSDSLVAHLKRIGGFSIDDKLDMTGEKRMIGGGYNAVYKRGAPSAMAQIEDGKLDKYLPYELRRETHDATSDQPYDAAAAYDYISDIVSRGENPRPYDVEEAQQQKEMIAEQEAKAAEAEAKAAEEEKARQEANAKLAEAGAAEREQAAEAKVYEEPAPELALTGQTEAEIKAEEKAKTEAAKEEAKKAAAPPAEEFALTGSKRETDLAAAQGAQDLFAAKPKEKVESIPTESGGNITDKVMVDTVNEGYDMLPLDDERTYKAAGKPVRTFTDNKGVTIALDPQTALAVQRNRPEKGVQVYSGDNSDMTVRHIHVDKDKRKTGAATRAMEALIKRADKHGKTLYIEPAQLEKNGMTREQLSDFYSKFGFKPQWEEDGRVLVREPGAKAAEKTQAEINRERQAAKRAKAPTKKEKTEAAKQKLKDMLGAEIGDTIVFNKDVGYVSANKPYVIESISSDGIYFRNKETGGGTSENYSRIFALKDKQGLKWELSKGKEDLGPQFETIKAKPGADVARIAKMLGPQLYGSMSNITPVSVKEMFQNSFDAIKTMLENGKETEGNIDIKMDKDSRTIEMSDDGSGMSANTLANVFLTIAGTQKETEFGSGGFGIAKMAFLYGNKDLEVITMRDGKISAMKATGKQLMDSLNDQSLAPDIQVVTPEQDPEMAARFPKGHGTYVKVTIPETYTDPQTGKQEQIDFRDNKYGIPVLMKSPLFANINVKFNGDTVWIGSNFDADNYTTFVDAKFAWGTARINVSKGQDDEWGANVHVLSNGLWQFSNTLNKGGPGTPNIPHRFYIDIVSKVKPDEAGYPFQLNRQGFTQDAERDLALIQKYLTVYYNQKDFENSTASFGNVQYLKKNIFGVEVTQSKDLMPKMPEVEKTDGIQEGSKVEVKDGRLIVNGKEIPEITPDQLKSAAIDVDALIIPQEDLDVHSPMLHDNLEVLAEERTKEEIQEEMDSVDDAKWKIRERLETEDLTPEERRQLNDNYMVIQTRYQELVDEKYGTGEKQFTPIVQAAREKFGQRFDDLMFEIGDTFRVLRNATAEALNYNELKDETVGVSFDKKYRGVSIRVPFKGMFVNPAFPEYLDTAEDVAYGFMGTMIHELAHHKVRSHDADFPAEMQRIQIKIKQLKGFNLNQVEKNLVDVIDKNMDIIKYLNKVGGRDESRPIGKRFKDSEFQATTRSDAENLVESGGEGWRGSELPLELRPRYQAIGEERESESVPPEVETDEDRRRLGEEILSTHNFRDVDLGAEKSLWETVKSSYHGMKELIKLMESPNKAFFSSMKKLHNGGLYLLNKNVFFGAALEARDIAKYGGKPTKELEDGQIMAAASVALVNAINAGHIATAVIKEGKLVYDNDTHQYRAEKSQYSMLNVVKEKQRMIKKYGKQNALNFIQAYFIAKRSQSIHDEYYLRSSWLEAAREAYDEDKSNDNLEALVEAEQAMSDITTAFNKIPYTEEEINDFIKLDRLYPELKVMMKNWTEVNHNMLDQQAAAGVISKKEAARLKAIKDYVPWYRVSEEVSDLNRRAPSSTLGRAISGLINIGQPKRFDKSIPDKEINNVIENMLHNVMNMTRNTVRNHAANRVVQDYATRSESGRIRVFPKEGIQPDGAVRTNALVNGRRIVVEFKDPLVAEAVLGMENIEIPMLAVLSHIANFRRRMISGNPLFQYRQWWMDAKTVAAVSNVKHPMLMVGEILYNILPSLNPRDPIVRLFREHGFGGHRTSARTPELELKLETGIVNKSVLAHMLKLLDHINDASDIAPRRATYKRLLKQTGDPALAMYMAQNIINFGKHGSGQLAQATVKTVFFMNAYAQQMHVLGQGFVGGGIKGTSRKKAAFRFYKATMLFALSTLVYCMLKAGDKDYDELDDQTKIKNYILPNGIKIPMHTSYSFFTKSVVELAFNKINKQGTASEMDRSRLNKALQTAMRDAIFPPNAVPSAVGPIIEVALNKNFFTKGEIVPPHLQNLAPFRQYKEDTSELAKIMSKMMGGAVNPINTQYLMNAYFGIISTILSAASNEIVESNRPTTPLNRQPFMSDFILPEVPRAKEEMFYDFQKEVNEKWKTFQDLEKKGHTAAGDQWMKENQALIEGSKYVERKSKVLQKINAEIRRTADLDYDAKNPETWPENKRARMTELAKEKNNVLDDIIAFRKEHGM